MNTQVSPLSRSTECREHREAWSKAACTTCTTDSHGERRFFAEPEEAVAFLFERLVFYIHLNPVRAGLVEDPVDHVLSGHREVLGKVCDPLPCRDGWDREVGSTGRAAREHPRETPGRGQPLGTCGSGEEINRSRVCTSARSARYGTGRVVLPDTEDRVDRLT